MASLTEHGRPNSGSGEPPDTKIPGKPLQKLGRDSRKGRTKQKAQHTGEKKQKGEQKPVRSVTTLYTMGSSFSQPATLSLSQGTSNAQPEKGCSVSSQVAVTCGCNVLHVQSNDLETMASFTFVRAQ